MDTLFLIPARGGSKGIPHKNSKPLAGKPLIHYSIEYARQFTSDDNICLSTDDPKIIDCAAEIDLKVPFIRPAEFSTDTASSFEVMKHAIEFYESQGKYYDKLVLLQPTSPFRKKEFLLNAINQFNDKTEVIVSVYEVKNNPYFNLFEENPDGYLNISKGEGKYTRRQDCPPVYVFNGSIYIFDVNKLKNANSFKDFTNIKKTIMPEAYSVDLDNPQDWVWAEFIAEKLIQNKVQ
jgi:CMP-N,N'-diacetyllegionaminic acid synthase